MKPASDVLALETGWRMAQTVAGAFAEPPADDRLVWHGAQVPGTVAGALQAANLWDFSAPVPLDGHDYWYSLDFVASGAGRLRFQGLATLAEAWLDGHCLLRSDNMFLAHEIEVARGSHRLGLCFRSLQPLLEKPLKRARWRSKLVQPPSLRGVRTSLIGHMPCWCPPVATIGPWRAVEFVPETARVTRCELRASVAGTAGVLDVMLDLCRNVPAEVAVSCAGVRVVMKEDSPGRFSARIEIPDVALWWPLTHGEPVLHEVCAEILHQVSHGPLASPERGGDHATHSEILELGRAGFRTIALDRDTDGDGFGLVVNGVPALARGAVWTNADMVHMPGTRAAYGPLLARMRDAQMNMVRIGGTFAYETNAFFDLCDELGILVWQDFMFANLDYPFADPAFAASAEAEVRQFLARTRASPALAVLCGGSEIYQQAAMTGVAENIWKGDWFERTLREIAAEMRPDAIYIPNTPFGGDMPFMPHAGTSHYYGVSAYMRPLEDVRRANVRFAAECLGFANVPEGPVAMQTGAARIAQDCWTERTPGDVGATWFFEEVRNHYLTALYGISPDDALAQGEQRYLELSRAVSAEIMESVFAEFRRCGSPARGGLVWFLKDVWPGAGWGVLDHSGQPKPAWWGLKRAFRPVQVLLSDEGLNGVSVHLLNETPRDVDAVLSLTCLAEGRTTVMQAERAIALAARSAQIIAAVDLWSAFFDTGYAYRFGAPSHDVIVARLCDAATGDALAEAFHFPLGRGARQDELGLAANLVREDGNIWLDVSCARLAQSVHLSGQDFEPDDNWFHLAPGRMKRLRLKAKNTFARQPGGLISAVNGLDAVSFGGLHDPSGA